MKISQLPESALKRFRKGTVIPAMPLATDRSGKIDVQRQRALIRYYLEAGAGGLAAGVHTTQFEVHQPETGLLKPLLELVRAELDDFERNGGGPVFRIAGVLGDTPQATGEAALARDTGFHAVLPALQAFRNRSTAEIIEHMGRISQVMPVMGFYLQEAVGGPSLDVTFWRELAGNENVVGIKIAPFDRYKTLDVMRGVAESGRAGEMALYTGNDDHIVADLLTTYEFAEGDRTLRMGITGGLLGHWSVWTKRAVELLERIRGMDAGDYPELMSLGARITDTNAAFFDATNQFHGCIVGLHEVLRRQGFLEGNWLLDRSITLSVQQQREIDRVYRTHPDLNDDAFVRENIGRWFS